MTEAEVAKLAGEIDPREPLWVQNMRRTLRVLHYAYATESAYVGWVKRFIMFVRTEKLETLGAVQITEFLTSLAVDGQVTANTQKQALSSLLFLYETVIGKELGAMDMVRAAKPKTLPVVLSREEIAVLAPKFQGATRLMFQLMYGSGLRHWSLGTGNVFLCV